MGNKKSKLKKNGKKREKNKNKEMLCRIKTGKINRLGSIGMRTESFQVRHRDVDDIPRAVKLNGPGFFFGGCNQLNDEMEYVGMPQGEDGNIAVIGGNGSGKSRGIVMPTLKTWQGGICATDIKGELTFCYKTLAWFGEVSRPYIVFDPTDEDTIAYDPFWWLSKDDETNLSQNIDEISRAIFPELPGDREPFWIQTERRIFAAALLYYYKLGLSFSESVCKIMGATISSLCKELAECQDVHIKMILGEGTKLKPETLACIDQGIRNNLHIFSIDPCVSHALRGQREGAQCFTWDDLDYYNIFLKLPEDRIDSWGRVLNLLYTQLFRYLMRRHEKYSCFYEEAPTLLLLDEFPRLGKIEGMTEVLSTLRSKNVNICLVMQSVAQLDKLYGPFDRRILLDNCQYKAILRANDSETQKYLAELIGTQLHLQYSVSEQLNRSMTITGYSRQLSESRDWTVCPHELSALEDVLLLTPYGFCQTEKCLFIKREKRYFEGGIGLASIDNPISTQDFPAMENQGAVMLTIGERLANANRRIADAVYQQGMESEEDDVVEA